MAYMVVAPDCHISTIRLISVANLVLRLMDVGVAVCAPEERSSGE